jgi:hypothetical protein
MRSRSIRGIWALGLGLALLAAGCLNSAFGACTPEAAAAFNEIQHYGGISLEPKDYPLGGRCVANFTSADQPEVVLDYYRVQWTAAGWTLNPSAPLATPPAGEGGSDFVFGMASARKDGMTYSVTAQLNGQEAKYVLLVGRDE